ncbi:MAG: chemotaxis protein CheD [Spirochaetes bacterium]|nr:chemotaxis protein CheD [Spirochaetota bacterium]
MKSVYNQEFQKEMYNINPGDYIAVNDDVILSTLLGSCIAACLYDPERHIIGMNHFMLVSKIDNPSKFYLHKAGRFALNAMELLINAMMKQGAKKSNLKAKAFGGANTLPRMKESGIAESNVEFVKSFLKGEGIPLVAFDLGGAHGRKILFFNNRDYTVLQKKIKTMDEVAIGRIEQHYLERQRTIMKDSD